VRRQESVSDLTGSVGPFKTIQVLVGSCDWYQGRNTQWLPWWGTKPRLGTL